MWDPELAELRRRREQAERMGGEERVARQHATGRLTIRERLAALTDDWREVGGLTGRTGDDGFTPSNVIIGRARLAGRRVIVAGDDFTVRGGAADAAIHEKQVLAERMAGEMRAPLIRLIDGTGGGGSVRQLEEYGRTYVPHNPGWDQVVANLGRIPVIALALGPVAGLGAARLVTSHVSIMVKGLSQVFIAGPAVVEAGMGESVGKEELGGWRTVAAAGTVDLVADSEEEAFELVRRVLSYLPQSAWQPPPVTAPADDPGRTAAELRAIVPRDRRRPYDMRAILDLVFDTGTVMELARGFAPSVITALARLDGHPVAVLASDPRVYGGGMTAQGADKTARFVDLAETFHLPVVHLVDQPGFVIGTAAERAGTIRRGARALAAVYQSTVPWASVLVRRVFGVAGAAHRPHDRYGLRVAWPSGDWGSLPIEGGLEVAFKRLLAEAGPRAAELKAEIAGRLEAVRSPFRTAEAFLVEDIIDPAETRPALTEWVHDAYAVLDPGPNPAARP
ncbi:propionyl-CoA carboxylase beta chain [Nonomuraea solani]|uniref:Propionyl-CoA carboxylase beta chain n=1 Tax=Nonomuraea solani TaxID=1144553 RepID=A0A1H6EY30_9ACTN|nr:carboxyl transferase domain-containing protein [Nonomuraea solani]SEH02808.1 propionyl-CoA carboxylase beta chain [Nonomuraea solani]